MEGWLAKEGKSLRARRTRYVRLIGHVLSSHRTKASPPSWQVSIADAIVDKGFHHREMKISLPHRVLSFTAPSINMFDVWIVALRRASIVSSRVDDYYRIGRLIGEGMNGQVRLAQDIMTDHHVAIKMVPRLGRENETEFLAREVQIILSIAHPNIVRTIDVFVRSRRIHFVMEYLPGGELFDFIAENNHFTETHAAAVMIDLLQALYYLHSKRIAHRDVKLENLLCVNTTWPLNVKLADFGFANYVNASEPILSSFVGTPYYIAPEMLRGHPHGRPVDIWASGVVLYILLSGKFPFGGKNESEYYQRVLSKEAYFPSEEWSKTSDDAKSLIRGMLCKDPQKRLTAEQCLRHPWLQRADPLRETAEPDIFPLDNAAPPPDQPLPSPNAFRDNREKRGKWRHLGMLNHSLTKPTPEMVAAAAARNDAEQASKEQRSDSNPTRFARSKGQSDGEDSSVNRRPSLNIIRRLLSSGRLSLDHFEGRFPSFRGSTDDQTDEASATPRKTLSLFARDGPLRRSFHRVVESRQQDDGINFVNSQSQRLPPKLAREKQRQQRQAEASRRPTRTGGIFAGRKTPQFTIRNQYHSSPRLQAHLAHPFQNVPTPPGQRGSNAQLDALGIDEVCAQNANEPASSEHSNVVNGVAMSQIMPLEPASPVSSTDRDTVRRTVSADVALGSHQFAELVKMDLLSQRNRLQLQNRMGDDISSAQGAPIQYLD